MHIVDSPQESDRHGRRAARELDFHGHSSDELPGASTPPIRFRHRLRSQQFGRLAVRTLRPRASSRGLTMLLSGRIDHARTVRKLRRREHRSEQLCRDAEPLRPTNTLASDLRPITP